MGLVGLGNVGRNVAQRLLPFGCRVMGWDPFPTAGEAFVKLGGTLCDSFTQMLPQLDLLSFHVPLTPQTANMLDRDALHNVKPGLRVINTARGGVIDPDALLEAVEDGRVSAAALDVISPEPPFDAEPGTASFSHPLLGHPRILVTPHMAASTSDAQQRIAVQLAASLKKALIG